MKVCPDWYTSYHTPCAMSESPKNFFEPGKETELSRRLIEEIRDVTADIEEEERNIAAGEEEEDSEMMLKNLRLQKAELQRKYRIAVFGTDEDAH